MLVTAEIGPYAQTGARLDVTASSIGDARSLQGGTLLPTPLRGPDGAIVALAQGPLSLGGFGAGGGGNVVPVNHLTVGRVPGGGLVQVARQTAMPPADVLRLALREPDFSLGRPRRARHQHGARRRRARTCIDAGHGGRPGAAASTAATVPELIARLEPLPIDVDASARVVINERTGTVVAGRRRPDRPGGRGARQPVGAHRDAATTCRSRRRSRAGETVVTPQTQVDVERGRRAARRARAGATLRDVVRALNTLGVTPRDIIAIMQALKAAGRAARGDRDPVSIEVVGDLDSARAARKRPKDEASPGSERERLNRIAPEFESMLLVQMLKDMRKSGSWDDDDESDTAATARRRCSRRSTWSWLATWRARRAWVCRSSCSRRSSRCIPKGNPRG